MEDEWASKFKKKFIQVNQNGIKKHIQKIHYISATSILYKRTEQVRKNHYTICKEAGCEGCADIKNQEDKVEVALISSKYSVTSLI